MQFEFSRKNSSKMLKEGCRDRFDGTQHVMHGTDPWAGIGRTLTLTSLGSRPQTRRLALNAIKKNFILSPSGGFEGGPTLILEFSVTKKCIKDED